MTLTKPGFRTPPNTGLLGMWLFLAALAMLFASSMLGYVLIRYNMSATTAFGTLTLPRGLWVSTFLVLAASVTIHLALIAIRRERQRPFKRWTVATLVLAVLFVAVQTPSLAGLLSQHAKLQASGVHVYGLMFFLILIHALHVVGGIVSLGIVTAHALNNRYDHESYNGVRFAAMYWHFLDVVWLLMFSIMFAAG